MQVRFEFSKKGDARFVSHLDMIRVFEKALRRADLPVAYSQGFNPHPVISFGPALPIGVSSEREYVDITFASRVDVKKAASKLSSCMPRGFEVRCAVEVPSKAASLNAVIDRASYTVVCPLLKEISQAEILNTLNGIMSMDEIVVLRKTQKGEKNKDIRAGIFSLSGKVSDGNVAFDMQLLTGAKGSVRPRDVLEVLVDAGLPIDTAAAYIVRTGLYCCKDGQCMTPMQLFNSRRK